MKRIIRLTEGDLHRIVKRSVNRVLRESEIFDDAGFVNSVKKFTENPVDIDDANYDPSDEDIYGALGEFNPDDLDTDFSDLMSYNQQNESKRRMSRIIKESIRKVLREASAYSDYDIAGNGGGNIITCYGSPGIINGKYQSSGVGSILGLDVIYLSCNPPTREMTRMYGQLVPVKVDVSNFYRAKNAWEAKKLVGLVGFKDEYSGILYHGNRDGDVCAVFDRSCIIG